MSLISLINNPRTTRLLGAGLDHGFQSIVNLTLSIAMAREISAAQFGAFSVAFAILTITWGAWRTFAIEPYMSRNRGQLSQSSLSSVFGFCRITLICSLPAVIIALVASVFVTGFTSQALLWLIGITPILVVLDVLRSARIGAEQPYGAALLSAIWAVLFVAAYLCLNLFITVDFQTLVILYASAAAIACVVGLFNYRNAGGNQFTDVSPLLTSIKSGVPLFFEFIVGSGIIQILTFGLAIVATIEEAAGFRGAMILAGVLTTLIGGMRLGLLSDAVNFTTVQSDVNWTAYAKRTLPVIFAMGGVVTVFSLLLGYRYGGVILGETWANTERALLPFMLLCQLSIVHLVMSTILRARNEYRLLLSITAINSPFYLLFGLFGAHVAGAYGAAVGACINVFIMCPILAYFALNDKPGKLHMLRGLFSRVLSARQ